jgi:hypothetical protein
LNTEQELKKQISYQKEHPLKTNLIGKEKEIILEKIESKKSFFFKTPQKIKLTKLDLLIIVF